MKSSKLGIWMNYSIANLIELSNDNVVKKTLKIAPDYLGPLENLRLNEGDKMNQEQNHQSDFYKELSYIINEYNDVLLYGPTNAKTELFNWLKNNHRFEKTRISVQSADNMNDNQQEIFVKDFFIRSEK
ncbi:MAG: hypothetical protein JXR61_14170 [Prolixibacteraceae bacterium]|nr:hypothetical protein [Prolixibacteraceae bacterium]